VDGKKMSKSEGTFITLDDIIKKGFSPLAFRLLCLQAHYRSKLNFTWESLAAAQKTLDAVHNTVRKLWMETEELPILDDDEFKKTINDDLNIPQALAIFFNTLSQINRREIDAAEGLALILEMDEVIGLDLKDVALRKIEYKGLVIESEASDHDEELPEGVLDLLFLRREAQYRKDWEEADALRTKINELGYLVDDERDYIFVKKL